MNGETSKTLEEDFYCRYPVLMEARRILTKQVSLFSGEEFMVDESVGLTGIVDSLMSRSPQISAIQAPAIVVVVVEAKKADLRSGFGQCVAEMVAADRMMVWAFA